MIDFEIYECRNVQDTNDFSLQNQHGGGVTAGFIEPSHTLFNNHGG